MISVSVTGDPPLCAERITKVMVSDMEAYILHSFSQPKSFKPCFNPAYSRSIHDKEGAHKKYLSLPSSDSHALFVSNQNQVKSVLQLTKHYFSNRKYQILSNSTSLRDFWHLAKYISNNFTSSSFPLLLHPDGTATITSVYKT